MVAQWLANKNNIEKLKLGAIPVLAIVMYFVLTSPSDDVGASAAKVKGATPPDPDPAAGEQPPTDPTKFVRTRSLPEQSLTAILQHDPFAFPTALLPPAPVEQTSDAEVAPVSVEPVVEQQVIPDQGVATPQKLAALQRHRVTMFLRDRQGPAAVIDQRVVHVGDLLEEGIRVVEISPSGVVLEVVAP